MPKTWPLEPGTVKLPKADVERAQAAIWTRLFQSLEPALAAEVARAILVLDFPPKDKAHLRALAAKARAGALTELEQAELDTYGQLGSIVSILKSKARMALRETPASKTRT
ncbi:MAG TPA: hypothetical protein VL371_17635 [Gemmataceae bacterium]|jgi:hypothetical protein|nr:hypothetical protein [Gemmataceae bacterium]